MSTEPRHVYTAGATIVALLDDWAAVQKQLHDAMEAWNEAHAPDWRLHVMTNSSRKLYIGNLQDLHPEWNLKGDERLAAIERMMPWRKALTQAGQPYRDKRGDIWRAEMKDLPTASGFAQRFAEAGMGPTFWSEPDTEGGRGYFGSPGCANIGDELWVLSMAEIADKYHSAELLTPRTLADYFRAKAEQLDGGDPS